jgi:chromosome segregation protein
MRLRTLRLHGFKSFADRTQLEFRDGITAIVGSNGCGKSNIADAIRWVLGEQRASAIRGAKMEEVIFQGTTKRRPLNFAEVALLFSNEQGRVAIPQTEIEIARKSFREGGSEYSLNRAACRLRDIHNLLRDTGLGSNAYSIIEAGMIETMLSDRAEERRSLFEEAAGIGRYKDSRQSTTRRLEAAEADLARLGDLIAEVESKVRSLARQRRRAQRYQELQARRLDLEVAAARREIAHLQEVLRDSLARSSELGALGDAARQARIEADERLGRLRTEQTELSARRARHATRLEDVRNRLHLRERETLLADERRSSAELRIAQLVRERAEQDRRREAHQQDAVRFEDERAVAASALASAREHQESAAGETAELRTLVGSARGEAEAATARLQHLARQRAAAAGERDALLSRRREAEQQLERLRAQAVALGDELARLDAQTDLWGQQADALEERAAGAADAAEAIAEEIRLLRARESAARDSLRAAEDRASSLGAQLRAMEALERSYGGFAPAVAAVMAAHDRFPGVHGPLADFISTASAPGSAAAVETVLGPLLHALVVDDLPTARRVRDWFRSEWQGGGSLLILPLDAPSIRDALGAVSVPDGIATIGVGSAWAAALLEGAVVATGDPLEAYLPGATRVSGTGDVVDRQGVVRLTERGEGEGILARRERLATLRAELDACDLDRERLQAERDTLRERLGEADERVREADELRRAVAAELQRVRSETAAGAHRSDRLLRERDAVERQVDEQLAAVRTTVDLAAARDRESAELEAALAVSEAETVSARERLAALEERWEQVRDADAERRVAVARAEAELREAERRLTGARQGAESARSRLLAIDAEAAELRNALDSIAGIRERADDEMQRLFVERDAETATLANIDGRLAEADGEARSAEEQLRRNRQAEEEAAEERHRLELHTAEARSRSERIAERLEAEWGRPWEALLAAASPLDDGDVDAWHAEIREIAAAVESIGPVNMLAVQEHEEEARRLEFLLAQQGDLVASRDDLLAAIRQINRTAREVFLATFSTIRENFQRTFHSLFQGGECDVWLADAEDPLESPIEIQASPRGKRTQRINLLSGGERTLTALALLFAIYLVKPSPFCLLDEVDAPLDESNVGRFIHLLQEFKAETQFVVITHNTSTMEAADWVYGVTMEEPGISSIVGVELEGAWAREGRVA